MSDLAYFTKQSQLLFEKCLKVLLAFAAVTATGTHGVYGAASDNQGCYGHPARNDALDVERRALLMQMGRAAFTVIVGPAWFVEFAEDMGELTAKDVEKRIVARKSMTLDNGAEGTITLREIEEKV